MILDVSVLPAELNNKPFEKDWYIVADILRATSFINYAFMVGVSKFEVFTAFEEAFDRFLKLKDKNKFLLAGERQAKKIPNFHLGNSLRELEDKQDEVFGKTILFSTTNGTRALNRVPENTRVLVGSFLNLSALVQYIIEKRPEKVHLVCAGTTDLLSLEDLFFAAYFIELLTEKMTDVKLYDGALLALNWLKGFRFHYDDFTLNQENLYRFLETTMHGKFLKKNGFEADLIRCAMVNEAALIPVYDGVTKSVEILHEA